MALGVDIRSGHSFEELEGVLAELDSNAMKYEILFLESSDDVLIKRYKETRRFHPLSGSSERVDIGIKKERERLGFLKKRADCLIDTSHMLTRELKRELNKIYVQNKEYKNLYITVAGIFLEKFTDIVEFLIPNYIAEGKTQLVIGVGCTGGKHRSVTLANELYEALERADHYGVRIEHRDIGKDAITKAK